WRRARAWKGCTWCAYGTCWRDDPGCCHGGLTPDGACPNDSPHAASNGVEAEVNGGTPRPPEA
ncbi:MAG TPA: hypothetical protein PKH96_23260, partial [Gemmatimonadaceae bacterium]|nr:hypothetical protein [Gemmatimonadaceae bacterium]